MAWHLPGQQHMAWRVPGQRSVRQQRLADGKALAARAASAASASSDGDRGASAAKVDAELRFMASAAPTGSGKCKICAEKIAKLEGHLRLLAKENETLQAQLAAAQMRVSRIDASAAPQFPHPA